MINQNYTNYVNKNAFAPVQSNSGNTFVISKPITQEQKDQLEEEKTKHSHALGYSIATTALVVGFGLFAFAKGMPKNWRTKIDKMFTSIEEKLHKFDSSKPKTIKESLYIAYLKGVRKFTQLSKAIYNTSPVKDAYTKKYIDKVPFLKKVSNSITNWFERVSVKTTQRAYRHTSKKMERMYVAFDEANSMLPKEAAQKINQNVEMMQRTWRQGFSEVPQNKRLGSMKQDMDGIDIAVQERICNNFFGFIKDPKTRKSFISEELAANAKLKTNNDLESYRKIISNGIEDNYTATNKLLGHIDSVVDLDDKVALKLIKDIKSTLQQYRKQAELGAEAKKVLLDGNISSNLESLESHLAKSGKYDKELISQISENISELKLVLDSNQRGLIQDSLSIYKEFLPENEYLKLKKVAYSAKNSLNKSVDLEGDKLFDKIRDLKIGSAPQDVLGVISSLGVVGYWLTKSDNNDERISVSLKYGIPTVGAIATTLYCTVGLVSAGPSLIIGLLSGAIINKLGIMADNGLKKYQGKKVNENEKSIAEIGLQRLEQETKKAKLI